MILLKNCRFVITQNKRKEILKNENIVVEENKISLMEKDKSDIVIDCSNKLILPGLINTHTHAAMSLFRGIADDMPFWEAWPKKIWPLEAKLNDKHVYYGTLLSAIEMIRSGTVCFNDMYFFGNSVKKAVEELGIRCFFSQAILDFPTPEFNSSDEAFKIFENLERTELFVPAIGTHSIYTCSKETLLKAKELAEKYNSPIHIHLSETKKEVEDCIKLNNCGPVKYLEDIGFLNSNIIAAHCVHLSEKEIEILKENRIKISHCPVSNLKLTAGIAPIDRLLLENISLGTDSPVSNNSLNLFEEMKFASLIQKNKNSDASLLTAQQVLDMTTANAAHALGIDSGSIENGKNADLILIDLDNITLRPFHDIISNLIYSFNGNVTDVIINGNIIMKDRRIKTVDEESISEKVEDVAAEFVEG